MNSRYPVVLVHGIVRKDFKYFRAFGKVERVLRDAGFCAYTAKIDAFGTVESNAAQLKAHVTRVLLKEKVEKVNLIAHSKGGLDARYMIECLGMEGRVASLTTICTPHRGAKTASFILKFPSFVTKFLAFWIDLFYRILGDERPDSLTVCRQLSVEAAAADAAEFTDKVYCQSYSTVMERGKDDISLLVSRRIEQGENDGVVSSESAKFGNYRGHAVESSISHNQITDWLLIDKSKRKVVYDFYIKLCTELAALGY